MINIDFGPWSWPHFSRFKEVWLADKWCEADTTFHCTIVYIGPLQIWWSWTD